MNASWVKTQAATQVITHLEDARPAWLWSGDGATLLWRNPAARLFNAGPERADKAPTPVPIRGQVARLIRLGAPGRSSPARVQFLSGERPVSATCECTPLPLPDGDTGLLIVAAEPVDATLLAAEAPPGTPLASRLLADTDYLILDPEGRVTGGSRQALAAHAPRAAELSETLASDGPAARLEIDGEVIEVARHGVGGDGASIVTFTPADIGAAEDAPPVPASEEAPAVGDVAEQDALPPAMRDLGALIDRLAGEESALFAPLGPADDIAPTPVEQPPGETPEETAPDTTEAASGETGAQWQVTGRGFVAGATSEPAEQGEVPGTGDEPVADGPSDGDRSDGVARYNFDELSRLLSDRIGMEAEDETEDDPADAPPASAPAEPAREALLLPLGDGMLVLNRLPLGVLVFRDQTVLFANRALTEMLGFADLAGLRARGLDAIFPRIGDDRDAPGPVTRLTRQDGTTIPVSARLQSITWQGQPALLLTARTEDAAAAGEAAVKTFCRALAAARDEGYVEAERAGTLSTVTARAAALLGAPPEELGGRPLSALVHPGDLDMLQVFLEAPARFAETERPGISLRGADGSSELTLFAAGRAGVVEGYFGTVRAAVPGTGVAAPAPDEEGDAALLARLSRSVRRPLNTVIGFSELIRAEAFGPVGNARYAEYARDIKTAGVEITALVDELDDYVRLREGRYAPAPAELDLGELLEGCVGRLRGLAGAARVLVRTAVSGALPRVRIDRASLVQALLNLIASAIAQTPQGGTVILSAQPGEDGGVAVHLRDAAAGGGEFAERFVVFRDGTAGEALRAPVRSGLGLALTRSLLAVNGVRLSVDPTPGSGSIVTLSIPVDAVVRDGA